MRRLIPLIVLLMLVSAPARAQTPDDAATAVGLQGYYLGPGTSTSEARVGALVAEARNAGLRLSIVILAEDPPGGATTFAGAVLDRVGSGTVVVLTERGSVGYETDEIERSKVESALDSADEKGGDDLTYLSSVVAALTGASPATSGGGSGAWVLLLIVALLVGLVVVAVRRSTKAAKVRGAGDLENARSEIKAQLDSMANDILDLSDRVKLAGSADAVRYFTFGSEAYSSATDEFDKARSLTELEALSGRIDEAAWQLDAAQAILDGQPVPAKPAAATARCFFDPTHRGPMEEATIHTSAGDKEVLVCHQDAEKLRRGEQPAPRMINVGRTSVPAPAAPRSHGGGGFGGMDIMSILIGAMSQGLPGGLGGSARRGGVLRSAGRSGASGSPGRSRGGRRRRT